MLPSVFPEGAQLSAPAVLALADGTVFRGVSVGAEGSVVAEVVFNTGMTGYQEILTDPSYCGQMVVLTCPHIGNVGVNDEDAEGRKVYASGLIVRDVPPIASNFRAQRVLPAYLRDEGVVGIAGLDTRRLTRHLREHGAQPGCIRTDGDVEAALREARAWPGMQGKDLAVEVTTDRIEPWTEGIWELGRGHREVAPGPRHVVAYDFGAKRMILRLLAEHGNRVTVVPATTPVEEVLALNPDGVFLSNGPGDPAACGYAIDAVRTLLARKVPMFGICLGHQILGLAVGASTRKMKFGHHGSNHPVKDLQSGRVFITSQNHGFEVDAATLPASAKVTHVSLFDGSLQGFELTDAPALGFQGHPEACPGPHDIRVLFERFSALMA